MRPDAGCAPAARDVDAGRPAPVEGGARVVGIAAGRVWLQPDAGAGCAACAVATACTFAPAADPAARQAARRFAIADPGGLALGERVVVGIDQPVLLYAALAAFALPLLAALAAAALAQWRLADDLASLLAAGGGLLCGFGATRRLARRLDAKGALAPRFLRRGAPAEARLT